MTSADSDSSAAAGETEKSLVVRRRPRGTPFRPGQTGNPGGRPKGARSLSTIIAAALREKVAVTDNGRTRRMTKLEAAVNELMNRAVSGEARATREVIALAEAEEDRAAKADKPRRATRDAVVIAELLRRVRAAPRRRRSATRNATPR